MAQYPTAPSMSRWVGANFLGWFLGIILIVLLATVFESAGMGSFQFFTGLGMGASVGFFQMRMLRKIFPLDIRWVSGAVLGMGVPFLAFDLAATFTNASFGGFYLALSIALGGTTTGAMQSTLLKTRIPQPRWWIATSVLAWVLAASLVLCVDLVKPLIKHNLVGFFVNISLILSGGIVLGLVTGAFLFRQLKTRALGA